MHYEKDFAEVVTLAGKLNHIKPYTAAARLIQQMREASITLYEAPGGNYYKRFWGGPLWTCPGVFSSGGDGLLRTYPSWPR